MTLVRNADLAKWHGWSLFVLLSAAGLALGSARPLGVAVVTGLALVAYLLGRIERGLSRHGPRLDGIGLGLLLLTGYTFLQAIPLPPGLVEFLSPRGFALHDGALAPLGTPSRGAFVPLSLDPPATLLAGLRMLAVTLTYLTVRHRLRTHGNRAVLEPVAAAGAVVALVFFLHQLAGWTRVYDLYEPRYVGASPGDPVPAPFLNSNHLAGTLGLYAAVAFGLALSSVDRFRRLTLIVAGAAAGGACLLTLSRGGILAFAAGQVLFLVLRLLARREERRGGRSRSRPSTPPEALGEGEGSRPEGESRGSQLAWASLGALLALSAGSYVAYDAVLAEFEEGDASKLELARDALPMALDHFATGVGRGAFLAAFPPYQSGPDTATFTHPENLPAQFLSEWGVPVGAAALLALLFVLGRATLRPPARAHNAAAIAAVFAVLFHNLVDFGLELPGLALPFVAVLAVVREVGVVGDVRRARRHSHQRFRLPAPFWLAAPLATVGLLAVVYPWAAANDLEAETDRFRLYARSEVPVESLADDAAGALARHPADYYLPFLAGVHLSRAGHGSPLAYWNRALVLFPRSSLVHFAVGAHLARLPEHRAQAAGEFGMAVRTRPSMLAQAVDIVARIRPSFGLTDEFVRLAGDDPMPIWDALADAWERQGRPGEAEAADRSLLRYDPAFPGARYRHARARLAAGDPRGALEHVRRAAPVVPPDPRGFLLAAQAQEALGRRADAVATLDRGLQATSSPDIPVVLADLLAADGDLERAIATLAVLEQRARSQRDRSEAIARRIQFLVRHGRLADALIDARRAVGMDPGREDLWNAAADLAERLGDTPGLVWALREMSRRHPHDPAIRERLRQAETRASEVRFFPPP